MRYLIMGAGALGSVFGGLLQHAGQPVAFRGRGAHFEALRTGDWAINATARFAGTAPMPGWSPLTMTQYAAWRGFWRVRSPLTPTVRDHLLKDNYGNLKK